MRHAIALLFILGLAWGQMGCSSNNNPASAAPQTIVYIPVTPTPSGVEGQTWNFTTLHAAFPGREGHTALAYLGRMWVIAGNTSAGVTSDTWYSSDGLGWSQATTNGFPIRYQHSSVVFNNQMWVLGGWDGATTFLNDTLYSTDGERWTYAAYPAAFQARAGHSSVAFNNQMWVIAGGNGSANFADAWYSPDGYSWSAATTTAAFGTRYGQSAVVYNNKMWVIGGRGSLGGGGGYENDVWYSSDGTTWSAATTQAPFAARYEHTSFVYDNKMWVVGGNGLFVAYMRDAWYSTDGAHWTEATALANWNGRYNSTSLVFNPSTGSGTNGFMWLLGGNEGSGANDIWYSP